MSESNNEPVRDFVGYGSRPPDPKWPGGARVAVNIVINYEEGGEQSFPDGDGRSESGLTEGGAEGFPGRDLAAESMFEYGSRVGIWRLMRIFQERNLPFTIFTCSQALERNPRVAQTIKENDIDVGCYGRRWFRAHSLTEAQEKAEIKLGYESMTKIIGRPPAGWYWRYSPTIHTRKLLVEHGGFLYDSCAYNDELPYWVRVSGRNHLVVPYNLANNDGKFYRGAMATGNDFFTYNYDAFDMLYREGATHPKMMSIGIHARLMGQAGRAVGVERFLDSISQKRDVWICRRIDIAKHWHATHPPVASDAASQVK